MLGVWLFNKLRLSYNSFTWRNYSPHQFFFFLNIFLEDAWVLPKLERALSYLSPTHLTIYIPRLGSVFYAMLIFFISFHICRLTISFHNSTFLLHLNHAFKLIPFHICHCFRVQKRMLIYRNKSKNSLIIDNICKLSIESVHYFFKPYLGNWDLIKYTFDNILRNHKFFYNMSLFYELISVYPFIKWHNSIYSLNSWKH